MTTQIDIATRKVKGVAAEFGATQKSIASIIGISRQAVSERYRGNVDWTSQELVKLANSFNISPAKFYEE